MAELPLLRGVAADGYVSIDDGEARVTAQRLAREEGILGGYSAGANLAAALRLLQGPERGGVIAILICDTGLKYMSTDLFIDT
jgi:cysteine synthase A